jgi:sugar O-acyltransferase (sialic acid O-acetyltransferase NeuD family)
MKKRIAILGSTSPEIVPLLLSIQERGADDIEILGFLDDDARRHGLKQWDLPVLGGSDLLNSELKDVLVVNNVMRSTILREKVWRRLEGMGASFYSAIFPTVSTRFARIGSGTIIQEGAILSPGVSIGDQTAISFGVVVAHESVVEECCFLAPGALLNGRVKIRRGAFIGSGAVILPNVTVGEFSMVGAGAVVIDDVPPHHTVFGVPARTIAVREPEGER